MEYPEETQSASFKIKYKDLDHNQKVTPQDKGFMDNEAEKRRKNSTIYIDTNLVDEDPTDLNLEFTGTKKKVKPLSKDEADRFYSNLATGTKFLSGFKFPFQLNQFFPSGETPTEPEEFWKQLMEEGYTQEDGTYRLKIGEGMVGSKQSGGKEVSFTCKYLDKNGNGRVDGEDVGIVEIEIGHYLNGNLLKTTSYIHKDNRPSSYGGLEEITEREFEEHFADIFSDRKIKNSFANYKKILESGEKSFE